jgi:hypothetical protein
MNKGVEIELKIVMLGDAGEYFCLFYYSRSWEKYYNYCLYRRILLRK